MFLISHEAIVSWRAPSGVGDVRYLIPETSGSEMKLCLELVRNLSESVQLTRSSRELSLLIIGIVPFSKLGEHIKLSVKCTRRPLVDR